MRLAVRIGVHTGPVVVGAMGSGGRQEQLALGDTPNIAARLQGLAAPNTVVVSAATLGLIEGFFTCQALGEHPQRGGRTSTGVPASGGERGADAPRRGAPAWADAPGRAGARGGAATGALGGEYRGARAGRAAQRRGGHWQIAPGRGAAGAHRARAGDVADVSLFPLPYEQRAVSGDYPSATGSTISPGGDPGSAARQAGARPAGGAPPPGGDGAARGDPAQRAVGGALPAAGLESAKTQAEDVRSPGGLAGGGGRAASRSWRCGKTCTGPIPRRWSGSAWSWTRRPPSRCVTC